MPSHHYLTGQKALGHWHESAQAWSDAQHHHARLEPSIEKLHLQLATENPAADRALAQLVSGMAAALGAYYLCSAYFR